MAELETASVQKLTACDCAGKLINDRLGFFKLLKRQ